MTSKIAMDIYKIAAELRMEKEAGLLNKIKTSLAPIMLGLASMFTFTAEASQIQNPKEIAEDLEQGFQKKMGLDLKIEVDDVKAGGNQEVLFIITLDGKKQGGVQFSGREKSHDVLESVIWNTATPEGKEIVRGLTDMLNDLYIKKLPSH
jgi:hypothetical protein